MFSMRDLIIVILMIIIVTVCWSIGHSLKKSEEASTAIETTTATEKAAEIATEKPTEATTEQVTEVVTTEKVTEKPVEITGKMIFSSERKIAERYAVTLEKDKLAEIDENGYGWVQLQYSAPYNIRENHLTRSNGSIDVYGHHETWYSTNEAAGQTTEREIPGKHVADDGTIRDKDGFICVASSDHEFYSIVMTSVGPGKVYDCGCNIGTIGVYTTW